MFHDYQWAVYHSFYGQGKKNKGYLQLIADIMDIHPRILVDLLPGRIKSTSCGKTPVFIHIPKTGGTYVNYCLSGNSYVSLNHFLLRRSLKDRYIPVGLRGTRWHPTNKHVLFTTVRNPYTFLRSYYHHVLGHGDHHNKNHYDLEAARRGFDYLIKTIVEREDVWPSRKFLYPQLFDQKGNLVVNWINRNESLDHDMKMFSEKYGLEFTPSAKKRSAPVKSLEHYYDDGLVNLLDSVYHRELGLFGYKESIENSPVLYGEVSNQSIKYHYETDRLIIS